ncbi:MAG: hypothetical protein P1U81_03790, partial [Verrucomicrobiales bacterium]|nr:hypothetical protein [Verrucomicrobiales bacterium]
MIAAGKGAVVLECAGVRGWRKGWRKGQAIDGVIGERDRLFIEGNERGARGVGLPLSTPEKLPGSGGFLPPDRILRPVGWASRAIENRPSLFLEKGTGYLWSDWRKGQAIYRGQRERGQRSRAPAINSGETPGEWRFSPAGQDPPARRMGFAGDRKSPLLVFELRATGWRDRLLIAC